MSKNTNIKKIYIKDLRQANLNNLIIPNYQRKYTWSIETVTQLITDIYENNPELEYFLGTVIIQSDMSESFVVIDGQQRLSTCLLIMKVLETEFNLKYNLHDFRFESKNDIDLDYLQKLIRCDDPYKESSNSNYYKNIITIQKEIRSIKDFNRFISNFNKTFLTVVFMPQEINQFKVFSTINSTGVPLSTIELVKSYLISKFEEYNLDNELNQLLDIFNYLDKNKNIEKKSDDLVRYFIAFQTKNQLPNKSTQELYNAFLNIFKSSFDKESFLVLWENFYKFSIYYLYLLSDKFQKQYDPMIILSGSINTYSVLIIDILMNYSSFNKYAFNDKNILEQIQNLNQKEIDSCLKLIEYYRLNIGFVSTNEKEITRKIPTIPNKIENKIDYAKSLYNYFFINEDIKPIKDFLTILCEKQIYSINSSLTLALFKRLEHYSNNKETNLDIAFSIEHILPQNYSKWEESNNNIIEILPFLQTICNLTLLSKPKNSSNGNELWKVKKDKLIMKDNLTINNMLRTFDEWNLESMEKWTKFLLIKIYDIWNFNEYKIYNDFDFNQFIANLNLLEIEVKSFGSKTYSDWISLLKYSKKRNPQLDINIETIKKALEIKVVHNKNVDKIIGIESDGWFIQALICILFNTNSVKDIKMNDLEFSDFITKNAKRINQIIDDVNY